MLWLSELLMQNRQVESFAQVKKLVQQKASEGEMRFQADIKPPFNDTPADWEEQLQIAFTMAPPAPFGN